MITKYADWVFSESNSDEKLIHRQSNGVSKISK